MENLCQACQQSPAGINEQPDDPEEPYKLCAGCHHRLMTHSLRPREWYNLCSIHGSSGELLSESYYNQTDGTAVDPEEDVIDADAFPCPALEDVKDSPEELLTYILTLSHMHKDELFARWYIHEDLLTAMEKHPPEDLISVFSRRLNQIRNTELINTIFHLCGATVGRVGEQFVRDNWSRYGQKALRGRAFAAVKCLPPEEGYDRVTHILSRMDERDRCLKKSVLGVFETPLVLDWIEENVKTPIDISWGSLAASSRFDWWRAEKWLALGRPLSLVCLDTLGICLKYITAPEREPKYRLLNPPNAAEFTLALDNYLMKDNVPRVRRDVSHLKYYAKQLPDGS